MVTDKRQQQPETKIFRTIEARYQQNGCWSICSTDQFLLPDDETLTFCEVFSRENYRIKVAIYGIYLDEPAQFGEMLCQSWFGEDTPLNLNWRRVELNPDA